MCFSFGGAQHPILEYWGSSSTPLPTPLYSRKSTAVRCNSVSIVDLACVSTIAGLLADYNGASVHGGKLRLNIMMLI